MSGMRRREFVTLFGGAAAAWPLAARAQQAGPMRRIGVMATLAETDPMGKAYMVAFREGLQALGWSEDRNLRLDIRWATPDPELIERATKELVALQPDLILSGNTPTTAALQKQTRTIPILFVNVSDPIGSGFVASLARPGGNITGFLTFEFSIGGKWLEVLKEIAPRVNRVAFIFNPNTAPYAELFVKPFKGAAGSLGVAPITAPVRDASEIEAVVAALAGEPNGGFIVMPDVFLLARRVKLPSSPLVTGFLPSILSVPSPKSAVSFPTEMTTSTFTNARRAMPIASLGARSRANFHSSSPSSLS